MNKKAMDNSFVMIVIVAFIATFALVIINGVHTGFSGRSNIAGEGYSLGYQPMNAYSCNADNVCEMQAGIVKTGFIVGGESSYTLLEPRRIKLVENGGYNDWAYISFHTQSVDNPGFAIGLNKIENTFDINSYQNNAVIKAIQVEQNGNVRLKSMSIAELSGQGNAFACLDENGNLFRSDTPCN